MKFSIIEKDNGNKELLGGWFNSFVRLGLALGRKADTAEGLPKRMVLLVPRKDFVTAAISIGLSMHKYFSSSDLGEVIPDSDFGLIRQGTVVRIEFENRLEVGEFVEYKEGSKNQRGESGPGIVTLLRDESKIRLSAKLILSVVALPPGFPQGTYEKVPTLNSNQELFLRQGAPAAIIFGESTYFRNQLETVIESDGFQNVMQGKTHKIADVARIDFLTPADRFPHFVNVFEQINRLPGMGTREHEVLLNCMIALLDGNHSTEKLIDSELLEEIPALAIIENGTKLRQENAYSKTRQSVMRLNQINNQDTIDWQVPEGISFWCWGKNE